MREDQLLGSADFPNALRYRIADVEIAIEAPADLLALVSESYGRFPRLEQRSKPHTIVRVVQIENGTLSIRIGDEEYCSVSAAAGHGVIGLELSNAIINAVARNSRFLIIHSAAVERNGEALCIAGRGMAGKTLLAAHFVSRGWRLLSDEYAFVEPLSGHIVPFPKLLYVRSSSLPHAPRTFRRSIEASPWYGMGDLDGIVFSGVDPIKSYPGDVWSTGARLKNLLVLVGRDERGRAAIEPCEPWSMIPELNRLVWQPADLIEGLSRLATAMRGVQVGKLTSAGALQTTNAIERWASRTPVAVSPN